MNFVCIYIRKLFCYNNVVFVLYALPALVVNAVGTNMDNGRSDVSNLHFVDQNQSRTGNVYVKCQGV